MHFAVLSIIFQERMKIYSAIRNKSTLWTRMKKSTMVTEIFMLINKQNRIKECLLKFSHFHILIALETLKLLHIIL